METLDKLLQEVLEKRFKNLIKNLGLSKDFLKSVNDDLIEKTAEWLRDHRGCLLNTSGVYAITYLLANGLSKEDEEK